MWSFSKWSGERAGQKAAKAAERQRKIDQLADEKRELERRGFEQRKNGLFWNGFLGVVSHPEGRVSGFRFWSSDFKQVLALLDDIEGRRFTPLIIGKDRTGSHYYVEVFQSLKTGSTDDTRQSMRDWVERKRAGGLDPIEFNPWTGEDIKENTPE